MSSEEISVRDVAPEMTLFAIVAATWLGGAVLTEQPGLKAPLFCYGTLAALVVYGAVHDPSILARE